MPNFLLSIENTESCPFRLDDICELAETHGWLNHECEGLGKQGCPACENTCNNCQHQNDCTKKIANDKMSYPRYLEFCSAHKRKE